METKLIALILGVALVAAMATVYTQSVFAVAATAGSGTGAAGHTKPTTVPPHHSIQTQPSKSISQVIHSRQFGKTKPPAITIKRGSGGLACWPYYWLC